MQRFILNGPQGEPLTLAEAKRFLRVDHAEDDGLILSLVKGARERIEARTGRALMNQTWRIVLDSLPWGGRLALPMLQVSAVTVVRIFGAWGAAQEFTPPVYRLIPGTEPPIVDVSALPAPGRARDGIEIDVTAGYGALASDVPEPLRQALRLMVAHAYAATGPDGRVRSGPEPGEINGLLAPYRLGRIGAALTGVRT
jgi:uncharacterized phiE125 gp8 family phage protein